MTTQEPTTRKGAEAARVHPSGVHGVSLFALSKGLPLEQVEDIVGEPLHQLLYRVLPMSAAIPPRLCKALSVAFPDAAIPVELGASLPHNEVVHAIQFAPTLGEGLRTLVRYACLIVEGAHAELELSRHYAVLRWSHPADRHDDGVMQAAMAAYLHRVLSELCGEPPELREVRVEATRQGPLAEYTTYFGVPVYFQRSGGAELVAARRDLARPLRLSDAEQFERCLRILEARRRVVDGELPDPVLDLRRAISVGVGRGEPDLAAAMRTLGMSLRTAQRVAARHGRSLRSILDEELETRAKTLLARDSPSLEDVAQTLGYADGRAFRRAFRRWTGRSPSAYVRAMTERKEGPRNG